MERGFGVGKWGASFKRLMGWLGQNVGLRG